jgi:integrase
VLWYTAERKRASLLLRTEDLDLDTGWLRIRAETRKGKTRDLMRRLPAVVMLRFRRFVDYDPGRELLFPLDCTPQTLANRYRKILRDAGLPHGRDSLYHRMRRSAISHFKRLGGDGTALADHSSPKITRESYEDPTIVTEQQAADLLFLPIPDGFDRPAA